MTKISKTIEINGVIFSLVCYNAEGRSVSKWGGTRKQFDIYITANGNKKKFYFYDSIARYPKSADVNTLVDCLECTLNDALAYDNSSSFNDFCVEFGYDTQKHIIGYNAYKGCQRACWFYEDCGVDVAETLNELNEMVLA